MGNTPGSRPQPRTIGNSRDGRGRALVENLPSVVGVGITACAGTLYSNTVNALGGASGIIFTNIFIDITGLQSSTTDLDIIGTAGVSHIGQITAAVNGTIFGGSMLCLEATATGVTTVDLYAATEATGAFDGAVTSLTETVVLTSSGAATLGLSQPLVADGIADGAYLYLCNGAAGTVGTYTAGRFLITLYGRPV